MGKERLALPTFLREKFSQGVLFVQTLPEQPGIPLPGWRRCLCAWPRFFSSLGSSSPSPTGAKWLPCKPYGAGAAAPPPASSASAAARIRGDCGGARGLGAWSRRWKRTREAGPPGAQVDRAGS